MGGIGNRLFDRLNGYDPAAAKQAGMGEAGILAMQAGREGLAARQNYANQQQAWGDFRAGNSGTGAAIGVRSLMANKEGGFDSLADETAADFAGGVAQNMGDILGGLGRAGDWAAKANEAASMAGAMAEAQNGQARSAIMKQAEGQADAMNAGNAAQTAGMTDNAIAGMNAYEGGMADIGMSGIEGSENMERNLEYGKSRAEAGAQMQYDMMGREAQGFSDSMANSFSDLSQNKTAAMQGAWGGSIAGSGAGLTADYGRTGQEVMMNQINPNDAAKLEADAALADAEAGTAPEAPEAAAAQQTAAPAAQQTAVQAEPAQAAATPATTVPAAAAPAQVPDAFEQLVDFLSKGPRSSGELEAEMKRLRVPQENWAEIQAGTVKKQGEGTQEWRSRLSNALKRGQ
jgi:hypothetical protein